LIIILEGVDGSGKTTLAKELAQRYNAEIHHEGPPPKFMNHRVRRRPSLTLGHYASILQSMRGKNVILDRWALGERVYGPILRKKDKLGADGWTLLNRLIMASGAYQVLCMPPYKVCLANWRSRHGELIKDETAYRKTYEKYAELAVTTAPDIIYDYTKGPWNHELTPKLELPLNMSGSPSASYLVVGEIGKRGKREESALLLSYFNLAPASQWLTKALYAAGFKEHELAWIVPYEESGHRRVRKNMWQNKNVIPRTFRYVIAVGETAEITCRAQDLPYFYVISPKRWWHDHMGSFESYVKTVRLCRVEGL
jgi:hypothetical protein